MVQNLAQAGRSHFCPTHPLYPPSRSYIRLFSWVEAKSVAVGLFTQLSTGVNTPYPTHYYSAYSAGMKKWRFPKGQDPVSVAVPHLAAEDFDQSGIDIAPQTGGVAGSTRFSYADQGPPPEPGRNRSGRPRRDCPGASYRNTNATGFTAFRNRIVQAGFDGYHQRITP